MYTCTHVQTYIHTYMHIVQGVCRAHLVLSYHTSCCPTTPRAVLPHLVLSYHTSCCPTTPRAVLPHLVLSYHTSWCPTTPRAVLPHLVLSYHTLCYTYLITNDESWVLADIGPLYFLSKLRRLGLKCSVEFSVLGKGREGMGERGGRKGRKGEGRGEKGRRGMGGEGKREKGRGGERREAVALYSQRTPSCLGLVLTLIQNLPPFPCPSYHTTLHT